jgi:hypothetical protein
MSKLTLGFDKGHKIQMVAESTKKVGTKRQVKGLAAKLSQLKFELTEEEQQARVEAEQKRKKGRVFQV